MLTMETQFEDEMETGFMWAFVTKRVYLKDGGDLVSNGGIGNWGRGSFVGSSIVGF